MEGDACSPAFEPPVRLPRSAKKKTVRGAVVQGLPRYRRGPCGGRLRGNVRDTRFGFRCRVNRSDFHPVVVGGPARVPAWGLR